LLISGIACTHDTIPDLLLERWIVTNASDVSHLALSARKSFLDTGVGASWQARNCLSGDSGSKTKGNSSDNRLHFERGKDALLFFF
jgi:hypothetical protein